MSTVVHARRGQEGSGVSRSDPVYAYLSNPSASGGYIHLVTTSEMRHPNARANAENCLRITWKAAMHSFQELVFDALRLRLECFERITDVGKSTIRGPVAMFSRFASKPCSLIAAAATDHIEGDALPAPLHPFVIVSTNRPEKRSQYTPFSKLEYSA
ncbi:hypothetical protein WG66_002500 [Moniliophthora roreri]|nr:hypothetical protein WG66_002500 [Moniliophthora roreri]